MWGQPRPAVQSSEARPIFFASADKVRHRQMAKSHEKLTAATLASETLQATSLRYNYGHGKQTGEN